MKRDVYYNKARTIKYYGLQCGTYKNGAMNCANTKTMSGKQLEAFLVEQINLHIRKYCASDKLTLTDRHREQIGSLTDTLNLIEEQIKDKEDKLTKMYEDYLDETISADQYKVISRKFSDTVTELTERRDSIKKQITNIENARESELDRKAVIDKYLYVDTLTRETADDFIDTVYIGEYSEDGERQITIDWKF